MIDKLFISENRFSVPLLWCPVTPCILICFPVLKKDELQPSVRIACSPEPTRNVRSHACEYQPLPATWHLRMTDRDPGCMVSHLVTGLRPWGHLIQMWNATSILWSSHKQMKKVLNRVQDEGSVYHKRLWIPKALFHHNWFIVEEEEGTWNSVFWALRCQVLSRHSWHLCMLFVRSSKVPLSPHHGLEYSCNSNMCQIQCQGF